MGFQWAERQMEKELGDIQKTVPSCFHPNLLFPSKNELFCYILTLFFIFPGFHPNLLFPSKNELFCFILTLFFIFPERKTIFDQIYLVYFSFQIQTSKREFDVG